jgi:hypothetical protein
MKNLFFALVAIASMVAMASCKKSIDPIHGTKPVDTSYWQGNVTTANGDTIETTVDAYFPLEEFKALGEKNDTTGQRAMVNKYRKVLTTNIVAHYPNIKDEKNIRFILGSGFAKNVKSGDGKVYSGKFKNELIIILNDPSVKDTIFLACGNGMLSPIEDLVSSDLGNAERWRFTIQKGEGLANYLPQLERWGAVANQLSIPIKDKDGKVVSQETYLNYLGKYQSLLFEGDVIDLLAGKVYNKAGQEVQFERRQAETKKANAKAKAESEAKAKAAAKAKTAAKAKAKRQRRR